MAAVDAADPEWPADDDAIAAFVTEFLGDANYDYEPTSDDKSAGLDLLDERIAARAEI